MTHCSYQPLCGFAEPDGIAPIRKNLSRSEHWVHYIAERDSVLKERISANNFTDFISFDLCSSF